jgi:hypothetical protein
VIILVVLSAWIVLVALVMGLCATARVGDVQLVPARTSAVREEVDLLSWAAGEQVTVAARVGPRPVRSVDGGATLVHSDGIAA